MATFEKRKGPDGTPMWRVKVRIKGHRPLSGTFKSKTDATLWAQRQEVEIRKGLKFDDYEAAKHTLAEAIELYSAQPPQMVPRHFKQRIAHLKWWGERLGDLYVKDVTARKISDAKRDLYSLAGRANREVQPATINQYLISLSALMQYMVDELHWLPSNPVRAVKKLEIDNARIRHLSTKEREALLQAAQKSDHPMLYPLIILAIGTGMRKGELLNLRWRDVDLKKGIIRLQDTKNGDPRAVPLMAKPQEVLAELAKLRRLDTDLIFARKDGKGPIDPKKPWMAAVTLAKLKDFRFHDLRHTAATYLLESGATLVELSAILGHRNVQMVKRYAHLADAHAQQVVERMNRRVFG